MHWIYLIIAGLFEIGWIISLKQSEGFTKIIPMIFYAACGFGAAFFLSQSLKNLPMSTAYASWVGIAMVGSAIAGILFYKEPSTLLRIICMILIVTGVIGLKFTSPEP